MSKLLLAGWFIIKAYSVDDGIHNYYLFDPYINRHVTASLENKLSYGEDTWIKLRMVVECEKVLSPQVGPIDKIEYFCSAESVEELECTESNSMVVNGIRYC